MLFLNRLLLRLRSILNRDQLDDQLSDEVAFHLAEQKAELMAQGMSEHEATIEARRLFGSITALREECRDTRRTLWLSDFIADVSYTLTSLRKAPSFAVIAILTLALGFGANTAFFSIAYGILARPLPYPDPTRLVELHDGVSGIGPVTTLRKLSTTVDYAGYFPAADATVQLAGQAHRLKLAVTTHNLSRVLGVQPAQGRWFQPAEELRPNPIPVVVSHRFWQTRLGASPDVLSTRLLIDEKQHQIVGVMPASFAFPTPQTDLWVPSDTDPRNSGYVWGFGGFWAIGRLLPGATMANAQAEIRPLSATVRKMFPWPMPDLYAANAVVTRHDQALARLVRPKLIVLSIAAGLLLLIACANVGNLLLARGIARRREFTLREALGASAARLIRQLLTENFVLVLIGSSLGFLVAVLIQDALPLLFPGDTPRLNELASTSTLLLGAGATLLFTVLLFTATPLIAARFRPAFSGSLFLIGGEVAIATTLLIGASLMGHTLWRLATADTGVRASQLVTARVNGGPSRCPNSERCLALVEDLTNTLRNTPGIRSVAWANAAPLDKDFLAAASDLEDHPRAPRDPASVLWRVAASPGYFSSLGIPLIEGRYFATSDTATSPLVTIISQSTARRFWPGQSPIGKKIRSLSDLQWRTVVGVVADVAQSSIAGFPSWIDGMQYLPLSQAMFTDKGLNVAVLLDTAHDNWPATLAARYPDLVISRTTTIAGLRAESVADQRSTATLLGLFATLGLILGVAGVHGVISHRAAQRTREIGIRIALGATGGSVVRMVTAEAFWVSTLGVLCGVMAAAALSKYLRSFLYGVTIHDPLSFALSPLALLLTATLAAALPAWRASRTDPSVTLRQQ
jgi:predicted permease